MALTRVQKKGRVTGQFPEDDSRVIDQFMDDVITYIDCLTLDIDNVIQPSVDRLCITRRVIEDFTIINEQTCLQRNPIINNGINVTVNDGGEWFIL